MEGRGTFVRVGLLLVVGAAVLLGLTLFLAGGQFRGGKLYETYFRESVQGLVVGAQVKYRGVTVGTVSDIGLVAAVYGKSLPEGGLTSIDFRLVYVRFKIDDSKIGQLPDTAAIVAQGVRARLATQGLTGLSYLELDFVANAGAPRTVPWTPVGDYIPSVPSTFSQVTDVATQLASKLAQLDVGKLLDNAAGLVAELRDQLKDGDLHQSLGSAALLLASVREQLERADVPGLTADLRQTSAGVRELAQGKATQALVANAATAAARFADAAAKLPALIASLQATATRLNSGTTDLTADLAPILRDAQATMANLRDTTAAVRRDPGSLLLGGPPPRDRGDR